MKTVHNIDERGRKEGCPLGHCCDRCNWYTVVYETLPQGEKIQKRDCVLPILATLQDETKSRVFGVQQAIEHRGNEANRRQDAMLTFFENVRDAGALPSK